MATAFDTFDQYSLGHYEGQVEDRGMADIVTRLAVDSDIGYGLAVIETDERSASLPTGAEVSNGITIREAVRDNPAGDNPTPGYEQDHEMSVIRVGRVWVKSVDGSAVNDLVYVVPGTGQLTNAADDGESVPTANIQLPGAKFKSVSGAGELALVQLNGN